MPTNPPGGTSQRFCPSCGTESRPQWQYCAGCGQRLPRIEELRQPRRAHTAKSKDLVASLIEEPVVTDRPRREPEPQPEQEAEPAPEVTPEREVTSEPAAAVATTAEPDHVEPGPVEPVPVEPQPVELELEPLDAEPRQGRVTSYVQFVAIVAAGLAVAVVTGLIVLNRRLDSFAVTGNAERVNDADRVVENVLQPLFFVALAVLLAGLVWWTLRRRAEMRQLGVENSRFTDGLAAASWIIPGANLVLPVIVLDEIWRTGRAERTRGDWNDEPSNPWLWAWSGLMAVGLIIAIGAAAASPTTIEGTIDANAWSGIGYALIALSLMVLVLTMSAVATTVRFSVRSRTSG